MEKGHFEKYVNLIRKRAHYYSKKYNIEYEELESQGFEIYVNALNNYDVTKSTFSTHLYVELNRLNDYCVAYRRIANDVQFTVEEDGWDMESNIPDDFNNNISMYQLLNNAKFVLSNNAYKLFNWILSWQWEKKYITKPTITVACKHFNKSRSYIEILWKECKNYWNNQGILLYC